MGVARRPSDGDEGGFRIPANRARTSGRRTILGLLLVASVAVATPTATARQGSVNCDFNGDGFDDAAIGVPSDPVAGQEYAGAVNVIYGSDAGLTAIGNQRWTQNSSGIADDAEEMDMFGTGVECGDFNGDTFADLAIGVIGEGYDGHFRPGAFHVLFGSADGLSSVDSLFLHRGVAGVAGEPGANPGFSNSLAVGDFNGDGRDDLAVGAPFDRVDELNGAGSIQVFMGHRDGLSIFDDRIWHRALGGIKGEIAEGQVFGLALSSGDFNGDGHDDLAVGAPYAEVGGFEAGAVNVIYGSATGLTAGGDRLFHRGQAGIKGSPNVGELFGRALAAGDFDGDGFDELAIGVAGDVKANQSGSVHVLRGSPEGLTRAGDRIWHRDSPTVRGTAQRGDWFGSQLAAGRFDDDAFDDLAIGAADDDIGAALRTGSVHVLHGSIAGLTGVGDQIWHQGSPGIKGSNETGDVFGNSVATGDYDGNGLHDLLVGVPGEDMAAWRGIGRIAVIYATDGGLSAEGDQTWSQRNPHIIGIGQTGDWFGNRLSGTPSR